MKNHSKRALILAGVALVLVIIYITFFYLLQRTLLLLPIIAALVSSIGFILSIIGILKEKSKIGYLALLLNIPIPLLVIAGIFIAFYEVFKGVIL